MQKRKEVLIFSIFLFFLVTTINFASASLTISPTTNENIVQIGTGNDCPTGQVVYGINKDGSVKCIVVNETGGGGGNVSLLTDLTDVDPALIYDLHYIFFGNGAGQFTSGPFSHTWLDDIGVYTHPQIDAHIDSVSNPHATTYDQVGAVGIDNNETITGEKIFTYFPITPSAFPDTDYQTANKLYVDSIALGMQWKPAVLSRIINDSITCNAGTLGDRYIVPVGAGGDWFGYDANLTECNGTTWLFEIPSVGWAVIVLDASQGWVYNGVVWALFSNPTSYTFSSGVKLVGFDVQSDLLTNGGLNLSGDSLQVSSVDWNKVNKTGSVINDLGNVNATPTDGQCLVYNGTSNKWSNGDCGNGTGGGGNTTSVATSTMYFASASQTAQGWTNMPLLTTELFAHVYSRLRMDLTQVTYYRLFADQAVAGASTAVLRLQYSANATTWLDCSGDNMPINTTLGFKQTNWIAMPSACKGGDYYLRLVGQGGDGVADPSFREIAVQFKSSVGSSVPNVSTLVGLSDVNITSQSDSQAVVWDATQGKWVARSWGIIGNTTNWTSVVTDTLFFASVPMTAQTWTNQPLAVTELFGITYARQKKDLTYSPYYRIYVDQGAVGYSTAVLRLQYSTDNILWLDCSGDNLAINTTGLLSTTWLAVPEACRKDNYLRLVGQGGDGVADPSWRFIVVQFKTLVGDTNAGNISLVGLGDVNITNPLDGQTIFWDGTQNRWVSRVLNLQNGSNVITTDVDFTASASATTTSVPVWTNMPLAITEFLGTTTTRIKIDLSSATEYRILINPSVIGSVNSVLRLQCSSDQILWVDCNDINTSLGNTLGLKVGSWLPYPTAYKGDVFLRIVGQGGDGVADPSFRLLKVQFHVIAGNSTGGTSGGFNETEQKYIYNSTLYKIDFNETYLIDSIGNFSNENSTIARTGAGFCIAGTFADGVTTSTTGVTLVCSEPTITEVDPYWTGNQSNYANYSNQTTTFVPYTGANANVNLGSWGIENANDTTGKLVFKTLTGGITPPTSSFVINPIQIGAINYILPPSLPLIGAAYLQVNSVTGALKWDNPTPPAETDPIYSAQNGTIVRTGNYNCPAGQYSQNATINSSGVFMQCTTPPTGAQYQMSPFASSTCPTGWVICDGTTACPNMTGLFIVGNSSAFAFNTTGGSRSYTPVGTNAMSSDSAGTPSGTIDPHALGGSPDFSKTPMGEDGYVNHNFNGNAMGAHTHTSTFTGTANTTAITPPYYSTIWCMKT